MKTLKCRIVLPQKFRASLPELFGAHRYYCNYTIDVILPLYRKAQSIVAEARTKIEDKYKGEEDKIKSNKTKLKTLKSKKDKELKEIFKTIEYYGLCSDGKLSYHKVRNYIRRTKPTGETYYNTKGLICNEVKIIEDDEGFPRPEWMKGDIHNRIIRGAIKKTVMALNSCVANYKAGNIQKFEFDRKSKRDRLQVLSFEDSGLPKEIKISDCYYHEGRKLKKITPDFSSGCELIYDQLTERYSLHLPIPYFPEAQTNESQVALSGETIVFDEGVRAFLTGYSPNNLVVEFGNDPAPLHKILARIDYLISYRAKVNKTNVLYSKLSKKIKRLWQRIRDMVSDLHWKICKFLTFTFKTIILPEFPVKEIAKAMGCNKQSKRLLYLFRHFEFKQRLKFKCRERGVKLFFVPEEFTSQTCGRCGYLDKQAGKIHICSSCHTEIDRDYNGSRNILIKTAIGTSKGQQVPLVRSPS